MIGIVINFWSESAVWREILDNADSCLLSIDICTIHIECLIKLSIFFFGEINKDFSMIFFLSSSSPSTQHKL